MKIWSSPSPAEISFLASSPIYKASSPEPRLISLSASLPMYKRSSPSFKEISFLFVPELSPRLKKFDWFFYEPEVESTEENIYLDSSQNRNVVKTFNLLGQEVVPSIGQVVIYTYDDGSVEKKFVVE